MKLQDEDCSESQSVDCDFDEYYSFNDDDIDADLSRDRFSNYGGTADGRLFNNNEDPEYFAYECLTIENVEQVFAEQIATVCTACKVSENQNYFDQLDSTTVTLFRKTKIPQ